MAGSASVGIMPPEESPFLQVPESAWIASNALAFAISDAFAVSPGHALVVTRRLVENWFDATPDEQAALMALVNEVRAKLDERLQPPPDGYNVGFNSGRAAGQTVPHVHIHVIPRYHGDMADPRGGVRHVIPQKGNYLLERNPQVSPRASAELNLSIGHPANSLWNCLKLRLVGAREIEVLASFVQLSGLDVIEEKFFQALRANARVRILVGDYLFISDARALDRLHGWIAMVSEEFGPGRFDARLVETAKLPGEPASFHPKAWRILNDTDGLIAVGSSNLSGAALKTGVEWNLLARISRDDPLQATMAFEYQRLWDIAVPLTRERIERYAREAKRALAQRHEPESVDFTEVPPPPRPWQQRARKRLKELRTSGCRRALISVATGLGKTWLAAFDVQAVGRELGRCPRVIVIAHRAEILAQAESVFRRAMDSLWPETATSWCLGREVSFDGPLVIASIQKLARPEVCGRLSDAVFDYAIIDEVHHAHAASYRRVLSKLQVTFALGLTATPERSDGVDVATLFDDVLAWHASIGDGIQEESLVPFSYIGLRDDVDYRQIPWRQGRFDPGVLEVMLENGRRMDSLWRAWMAHPGGRTLVFCSSQRHALYTRDWLRRQGVRAAAVFAAPNSDPRSESLEELERGALDAVCAVDLFNEGVDLPTVDRVVMLRPTESRVLFLQQLGRGLRATPGKSRLIVIDFVGNHRVFARRLIHLLSLHRADAGWIELRRWLDRAEASLPPGCLLEVAVEARDMLRSFIPGGTGAAVEAYRGMRDEQGRRPTMAELFHRGYEPNHPYYTRRRKLHLMLRLVPFVERNFNSVELGPRGTGKSFVYQQMSPYCHLVSGGQTTTAQMFVNLSSGQRGLVCLWDVVAFDEAAGVNFSDKSGINIMKGYMEDGAFSRGRDIITAEGSIVFVGNIDGEIATIVRTSNLFYPMPREMDTAFYDRIHAYRRLRPAVYPYAARPAATQVYPCRGCLRGVRG